jgi:predicted HNH restriction endonuclease
MTLIFNSLSFYLFHADIVDLVENIRHSTPLNDMWLTCPNCHGVTNHLHLERVPPGERGRNFGIGESWW